MSQETNVINALFVHDPSTKISITFPSTCSTVILPQSALDALGKKYVHFKHTSVKKIYFMHAAGTDMDGSPMMFELTHEFEGQIFKTHCGVREFSAPEGKCYVPYWVSTIKDSSVFLVPVVPSVASSCMSQCMPQ